MEPMGERFDVAVVGGGILGLATAYRIQQRWPGLSVGVVEKEPHLAGHQSSHNSGVLHSGVYYKPGSLKARLCRQGKAELERFAEAHDIPFRRCGKLIVAVRPGELPRLADLRDRAAANGVNELEEVSPERIVEIEPHAAGLRGLFVPETGIIDYRRVALALADEVRAEGGSMLLGRRVETVRPGNPWMTLETSGGAVEARWVVACAGLQSDRLAARTGASRDPRIVPFRGSYLTLRREARHLVRGLIYPVPDPALPFLGVHFTSRLDGQVWVGPNAVLAFAREGYSPRDVKGADLLSMFSFPGFWRLARRHYGEGLTEMRRALFRRALVRELQRYVPEVGAKDLVAGPSGVRAQAVDRRGGLIDDFAISETDRVLHVRNAPSPAATASLAIGYHIADRAAQRFGFR